MGPRALKLLRRYIQLVLLQERPEPLKVAIEGMRIWGVLPEQGRGHFIPAGRPISWFAGCTAVATKVSSKAQAPVPPWTGHACSRAQDAESTERRPRELQSATAHLGRWRAEELEEALDSDEPQAALVALRAEEQAQVLGEALLPGVRVVALLNRSGLLLGGV